MKRTLDRKSVQFITRWAIKASQKPDLQESSPNVRIPPTNSILYFARQKKNQEYLVRQKKSTIKRTVVSERLASLGIMRAHI